jgi:hypothetical protein
MTVPSDLTATLMGLPPAAQWETLQNTLLKGTGIFVTGVDNDAMAEYPAEFVASETFAAAYDNPEAIDLAGCTRGPGSQVRLNGAYNVAFGVAAGGCGMLFEVPKNATISFTDSKGTRASARHAEATPSYNIGGCVEYTTYIRVGPDEEAVPMRVTAWLREAYLVITWKVCPKTGARTTEAGEIVLVCGFVSQTESVFKVRI